ncbi:MAG: hypothetical protein LW704_04935, partial [Cryomorphaceae bacterium]|nr:hypothetical protein [Cryomorphaceae bacterium]
EAVKKTKDRCAEGQWTAPLKDFNYTLNCLRYQIPSGSNYRQIRHGESNTKNLISSTSNVRCGEATKFVIRNS